MSYGMTYTEYRQQERKGKAMTTTCEWFALCDQPATITAPGPGFTSDGKPAMIEIPICDRCNEKLSAIGG